LPEEVDLNKEAVKLFGRLAEKYILLDASAGQCCYSGCADCEFRLPGGGYRMADQSSARPKWIPAYSAREGANGKKHETKWSVELFGKNEGLTQDDFAKRLVALDYAAPLGGPSVAASAADVHDTKLAEALFVILAGSQDGVLVKKVFSKQIKVLAQGDEGLTWAGFQSALLGL
jgi:hypothetical protein